MGEMLTPDLLNLRPSFTREKVQLEDGVERFLFSRLLLLLLPRQALLGSSRERKVLGLAWLRFARSGLNSGEKLLGIFPVI